LESFIHDLKTIASKKSACPPKITAAKIRRVFFHVYLNNLFIQTRSISVLFRVFIKNNGGKDSAKAVAKGKKTPI